MELNIHQYVYFKKKAKNIKDKLTIEIFSSQFISKLKLIFNFVILFMIVLQVKKH